MTELAAALLLLVTGGVLYVGWRRGRFWLAVAGVAAALFAMWVAAVVAVANDYRDADGFMDCWPDCTGFQEAVKVGFWFTLPALVLVLVSSLLASLAVLMWRRGRAARRPG